jgi:hypothetical protein
METESAAASIRPNWNILDRTASMIPPRGVDLEIADHHDRPASFAANCGLTVGNWQSLARPSKLRSKPPLLLGWTLRCHLLELAPMFNASSVMPWWYLTPIAVTIFKQVDCLTRRREKTIDPRTLSATAYSHIRRRCRRL